MALKLWAMCQGWSMLEEKWECTEGLSSSAAATMGLVGGVLLHPLEMFCYNHLTEDAPGARG